MTPSRPPQKKQESITALTLQPSYCPAWDNGAWWCGFIACCVQFSWGLALGSGQGLQTSQTSPPCSGTAESFLLPESTAEAPTAHGSVEMLEKHSQTEVSLLHGVLPSQALAQQQLRARPTKSTQPQNKAGQGPCPVLPLQPSPASFPIAENCPNLPKVLQLCLCFAAPHRWGRCRVWSLPGAQGEGPAPCACARHFSSRGGRAAAGA